MGRSCARCGATITKFAGYEPGKGDLCLGCYLEFQLEHSAEQMREAKQPAEKQ